ncbi:MAG: MucB/RseB C-terminal domain-containing protein [Thiobacillus sp.]
MRSVFALNSGWLNRVGRQGWLAVGLAGLMALSATAQAASPLDWLNRGSAAARQLNYSGVYVYHHGEHVEVLRVQNRIDAGGRFEKVEVLDGTPRRFLRVNNDVYCHLPDGKHVRLERDAPRRFFPALLPAQPATLLNYYDVKFGGSDRVAGRRCQVLILNPRDDYRHAFVLWLDRQTGLPLKSRIVNSNGGVVSMFVFSEVQIGKAPDISQFQNDLAGKTLLKAGMGKSPDTAWRVTPPPGFQQVQAAMRTLPGKQEPVTHLVFSDGLGVLSMFIEPEDGPTHSLHGLTAEGAISVYARLVDGYTVTTMGEVPNKALIETGNSVVRR